MIIRCQFDMQSHICQGLIFIKIKFANFQLFVNDIIVLGQWNIPARRKSVEVVRKKTVAQQCRCARHKSKDHHPFLSPRKGHDVFSLLARVNCCLQRYLHSCLFSDCSRSNHLLQQSLSIVS